MSSCPLEGKVRTTDGVAIDIAGIRLSATCDEAAIRQEPDSVYRPFLSEAAPCPDTCHIHIRLELGNIPDTSNLTELFDTGESWSMLSDGESCYVVLAPPSLGEGPIWVARMDRDFAHATVYCGDGLIHKEGGTTSVSNPVRYPLDQILLMHFLARRQGLLLHAAGIGIGDSGFLFPGRSGAGKSTLVRLLAGRKRLRLLSDDRVVVREVNDAFGAYGTPWPGEAGIAANASAPLAGVFFLRHGAENSIKGIEARDGFERLLPAASIPWYDRETVPAILSFCEELISRVPMYELCFRPCVEVVDVFEEFVSS